MKPTLVFYAPKETWRLVDADGGVVHECGSFTEACDLQRAYGVSPPTGAAVLVPVTPPKASTKASSKKR